VHNDTTLLLGLADVVVDRVELDPDGTRVIHMTTANTPQACPSCETPATSVKGWVTTQPRHLPFPVATRLLWRKRRWRCQQPACARSSFTESAPQIPPAHGSPAGCAPRPDARWPSRAARWHMPLRTRACPGRRSTPPPQPRHSDTTAQPHPVAALGSMRLAGASLNGH